MSTTDWTLVAGLLAALVLVLTFRLGYSYGYQACEFEQPAPKKKPGHDQGGAV